MSKSLQNINFGHHASASQPGTATPPKLKMWASSGSGVLGEFQRQVNRMFRVQDHVRPAPHVIHIEDIFKGLNLDSEAEHKLSRVIEETPFKFGTDEKLRVPTVVQARIRLMDSMRAMKQIDSSTRMEIVRRAQVFWKRNGASYDRPTTIRYVARKSMRPMLKKADKKKKPEPTGDIDEDGVPNSLDEDPQDEGAGPSEVKGKQPGEHAHPKDRKAEPEGGDFASLSPEEKQDVVQRALKAGAISEEEAQTALGEIEGGEDVDAPIVSAVEAMEEKEVEGGRELHFGEDVSAHLPDDADFHHHATEYAKHRAAFQINKDKDPKKADAHKHAANIHASIGNAMHQAGDLERRRLPGSKGDGKAESLASAEEQAANGGEQPNADLGEPEDLPMPGGPLGTDGPGGAPAQGGGKKAGPPPEIASPRDDIVGGEQPGMPDDKRNVPGRDSDIEVAQRLSGKLRVLLGKLVGKQLPARPAQKTKVPKSAATPDPAAPVTKQPQVAPKTARPPARRSAPSGVRSAGTASTRVPGVTPRRPRLTVGSMRGKAEPRLVVPRGATRTPAPGGEQDPRSARKPASASSAGGKGSLMTRLNAFCGSTRQRPMKKAQPKFIIKKTKTEPYTW